MLSTTFAALAGLNDSMPVIFDDFIIAAYENPLLPTLTEAILFPFADNRKVPLGLGNRFHERS